MAHRHWRTTWTAAAALTLATTAGLALLARPSAAQDNPIPAATPPDAAGLASKTLRPPAVPLVAGDPYLSLWSEADHLTDVNPRHWTGKPQPLYGMVRVDGKAYRLMGADPTDVPPLPQVGLRVSPTKSVYDFEGAGVHVTLTFLSPLLPHELDVMSRPVTYLTFDVRATDGGTHAVQLLDATSGLLAVDQPKQAITWAREDSGPLRLLKMGSQDQRFLGHPGDDTRIDWGYAYTVADDKASTAAIAGAKAVFTSFAANGTVPADDDARQPRPAGDDEPVAAVEFDLGTVAAAAVTRQVMVGYDQVQSINYYGKALPPYWRRNGATPGDLFQTAAKEYAAVAARAAAFDAELMADARRVGGDHYADVVALAYRQCWAGCGLVADAHKQPHLFAKENTSDGNIATVDVIFPMDPVWVLLSPGLAKASLAGVLQYSASPHWKFPNAPHDLGEYPVIMGRDDGGEGMPVEESGNVLILADAIAQADAAAAGAAGNGNGNGDWVTPWWPQLTQWARFLEQYGLDPGNQLCTDDFMGPLAHNANLSVKAILALAAYGDLCRMRGDAAGAQKYTALAKADAEHWMAAAADGDHYRLAFDKPNTWSLKYNLVWDRILGLNVFPPEVAAKEVAYYKTKLQKFGLPLDSRTKIAETPWTLWSATLATDGADFAALTDPLHLYLNQTTNRQPFADSYESDNPANCGMHARPVVGSVFIKLLADGPTRKKWAAGDGLKVGDYAPIPPPPQMVEVFPTARKSPGVWLYTFQKPADDGWVKPDFETAGWHAGLGGFGTDGTPGAVIGTKWSTDDVWLRRDVVLPPEVDSTPGELMFLVNHDEDVQIYVDGIPAADESGFNGTYLPMAINASAKAKLKAGAHVTLAVHCHQTDGGQYVDVGLARVVASKE